MAQYEYELAEMARGDIDALLQRGLDRWQAVAAWQDYRDRFTQTHTVMFMRELEHTPELVAQLADHYEVCAVCKSATHPTSSHTYATQELGGTPATVDEAIEQRMEEARRHVPRNPPDDRPLPWAKETPFGVDQHLRSRLNARAADIRETVYNPDDTRRYKDV